MSFDKAIERLKMASPPENEEQEWLRAAQQGDNDAFDRLVGLHLDRLYRFCLRLLGNEADAKDVCMDTFLTAHRRLRWLRAEPSIASWLYRTASRRCWRVMRRNRRRGEVETAAVAEQITESPQNPAESASARSDAEYLRACLDQLPKRYRLPLVLRFVEEQEFDEIARILGCTSAVARLRVHRALKHFERVYRTRGSQQTTLSANATKTFAALF